jgi:hypothetical protein
LGKGLGGRGAVSGRRDQQSAIHILGSSGENAARKVAAARDARHRKTLTGDDLVNEAKDDPKHLLLIDQPIRSRSPAMPGQVGIKPLPTSFDDERLDTLFLALPISWRGTLTQYAGRLHRLNAAKRHVIIYDYVDSEVPVLARMYAKRRAGYRTIGYEIALPQDESQAPQLALQGL